MRYEDCLGEATRLARAGEIESAVAAYREAVLAAPDRPEAHYELGLLHYQQGNLDRAISCLERVAELDADDVSAFNDLGVMCYEIEEWDEAIGNLKHALRLDPYYADGWYNLGRVYLEMGRSEDTALAWQQCLSRKPDHRPVRRALRRLPIDKLRAVVAGIPIVSLPARDRSRLNLMGKDYSDCRLVREGGRVYLVREEVREWFRVHLVSARWANHPWGMGNDVYDTLERMGFDVIDTDFRKDFRHLPRLLQQDAHLTFVLKGNGIPPDSIRRMRGITVLWYPDDLLATPHGPCDIAYNGRAFDLVYGFARYDLTEYAKYGVAQAKWLPLACHPPVHRELDLPKLHDVCFVGNIYPNRAALLERLSRRFDLLVTRAYGEGMVRIYNQSRIVLNLGIGRGGVQHRVFEALACGSLLLTNELDPAERLFQDKVHLVYYNEGNIEDLIAYYLAHPEEREAIARQGREEAIRNHTCVHRIQRILGDVLEPAARPAVAQVGRTRVVSSPETESALRWAEQRVRNTGWCISKRALRLLVANLPQSIQDVAEFGAGYSTLFLARLSELRNKALRITSFEHRQVSYERLKAALRPFPKVRLINPGLKQLSADEYEALFSSRQPATDYLELGTPVPRQLYSRTRLRNAFYDTDLLQQLQGEVDLVILDGPNGNGRSIVFPLLRAVVRTPFFCFVDDITHYPYMEQMSRVFDYDILFLENSGRDAYVLVRLGSVK